MAGGGCAGRGGARGAGGRGGIAAAEEPTALTRTEPAEERSRPGAHSELHRETTRSSAAVARLRLTAGRTMASSARLVTIKRSGDDGAHFPLTLSSCLFGR